MRRSSDSADRDPKPMGREPQPVSKSKPESNGSKENKGYKEGRDHTTGAEQGDTRKAARKPKQ